VVVTMMTSNRPYLLRALYEWITDNGLTPHLLVNAELTEVEVPRQYVHEGRIVLNISATAVQGLRLGNDQIEFSARFGGMAYWIRLPPTAVMAIYARENGQGMVFAEEQPRSDKPPPKPQPAKKPSLRVIK
jgi:stringent starvation protein B